MKKTLLVILFLVLLLAAGILVLLGISRHRILVVDAIGRAPIPGAYIYLEYSSGPAREVGRTDENGRLTFWNPPFPVPRTICAESTFYPRACVGAIGLEEAVIEMPVP
jgi:hypothetical protein